MQAKGVTGAVAGGLVAGFGLTALMMLGEKRSGKPSELIALERTSARRLGLQTPPDHALPDAGEQAFTQGGHLFLSGLAGLAYAAVTEEDATVLPSGIGFGFAFYAAMHRLAGTALGVKV